MYPEEMIKPMREELINAGVKELRTPEEVVEVFSKHNDKLVLCMVNSVCGCAGSARPAFIDALNKIEINDEHIMPVSVFAGADIDATERAREFFTGFPPSSPCFAFLKNGELLEFIAREQIQGRSVDELTHVIKTIIEEFS